MLEFWGEDITFLMGYNEDCNGYCVHVSAHLFIVFPLKIRSGQRDSWRTYSCDNVYGVLDIWGESKRKCIGKCTGPGLEDMKKIPAKDLQWYLCPFTNWDGDVYEAGNIHKEIERLIEQGFEIITKEKAVPILYWARSRFIEEKLCIEECMWHKFEYFLT